MSLVYTITSGYLECQSEKIKIPFALVFLENGVYRIELLLPPNPLHNQDDYFTHYYKLVGITEKKYDIECSNLQMTKHSDYNSKVEFVSQGYIKLTKPETYGAPPYDEELYKREKIWFVELENLKTCFANFTNIKKSRFGEEEVDYFPNSVLDHTETPWAIDNLIGNGNYFKFKLIQKKNSENLLIDFRETNGYCKLYYDEYLTIKDDLIALLTFMNGGLVKVRKEHYGKFYGQSIQGYSSTIEINYSFINKYADSYNSYLNINSHHSYSSQIFNEMFLNCFNKFQYYNKILELDSLIFSLTVSSQTMGLKERYFILITALEKVAKKYSEFKIPETEYFIENDFFDSTIKSKLLDSILPIKQLDKGAWNRMNSILSNLNINNSSTKTLYNFLNFAKIPLSVSVKKLIKKERNLAVHEGKIGGTGQEMFNNYLKLDHVLRDCLLNIIGYHSIRNRKGYYATLEEFENSNPKKNETYHYVIK